VSDDVHRRARELEKEMFSWISREYTPDVIWDDGWTWGDTFHDVESREVAAQVEASEQALYVFLKLHRPELEWDSRWELYFVEIDRQAKERVKPAVRSKTEDAISLEQARLERRASRDGWARGSSGSTAPRRTDGPPTTGRQP